MLFFERKAISYVASYMKCCGSLMFLLASVSACSLLIAVTIGVAKGRVRLKVVHLCPPPL